ncbi:hypothetical protein Pfo_014917 [Paulownia fortunei]|nr:hypothetical protein Pfo_014917 [Paulownia fortunei]
MLHYENRNPSSFSSFFTPRSLTSSLHRKPMLQHELRSAQDDAEGPSFSTDFKALAEPKCGGSWPASPVPPSTLFCHYRLPGNMESLGVLRMEVSMVEGGEIQLY